MAMSGGIRITPRRGGRRTRNLFGKLDPLLDGHARTEKLLGIERVHHEVSLVANSTGRHDLPLCRSGEPSRRRFGSAQA
jgi:hypothetical protein